MTRTHATPLRRVRGLAAALVATALCLAPMASQAAPAWTADTGRYATMGVDLVILRPLGLIVLAAGTGLYIPAVWMTAFGGQDTVEEAWERFMLPQGEYVFARPLGEF